MSEPAPDEQGTQTPPEEPKTCDSGAHTATDPRPVEHGGPKGPEPTRYGDWERNGKCVDF